MGRPIYAAGTVGRVVLDLLQDAPDQTLPEIALYRAVAIRRPGTKRPAITVTLRRMIQRADIVAQGAMRRLPRSA